MFFLFILAHDNFGSWFPVFFPCIVHKIIRGKPQFTSLAKFGRTQINGMTALSEEKVQNRSSHLCPVKFRNLGSTLYGRFG